MLLRDARWHVKESIFQPLHPKILEAGLIWSSLEHPPMYPGYWYVTVVCPSVS